MLFADDPTRQADLLALIEGGMSLSDACRQDGMPARSIVYRFIEANAEFRDKYARAATARADLIFEEMLDIADDGSNDWMARTNADGSMGDAVLNGEHVQRSRLRIDARKWMLSKMNPKKYGEKIAIGGAADMPPIQTIDPSKLSTAALTELLGAFTDATPETDE